MPALALKCLSFSFPPISSWIIFDQGYVLFFFIMQVGPIKGNKARQLPDLHSNASPKNFRTTSLHLPPFWTPLSKTSALIPHKFRTCVFLSSHKLPYLFRTFSVPMYQPSPKSSAAPPHNFLSLAGRLWSPVKKSRRSICSLIDQNKINDDLYKIYKEL